MPVSMIAINVGNPGSFADRRSPTPEDERVEGSQTEEHQKPRPWYKGASASKDFSVLASTSKNSIPSCNRAGIDTICRSRSKTQSLTRNADMDRILPQEVI